MTNFKYEKRQILHCIFSWRILKDAKKNSFVWITELDCKQQSARVIFPKMALWIFFFFKPADCFGNSRNIQE